MLALLLVVTTASPVSVAAPAFQTVGLEPAIADAMLDRFVTQLSATGEVKVTSSKDIAQALGVERQRQLAGCADQAGSCLAELAGALGADLVMSVNIVQAGSAFTVTLRFIDAKQGRAVFSATDRAAGLDALQAWLDRQVGAALEQIRVAFPQLSPPPSSAAARGRSLLPWVGVAVSAVAVAIGAVVFAAGKLDFSALQMATDDTRIDALVASGPPKERAGVGLLIVGGVCLAVSLIWAIVGGR